MSVNLKAFLDMLAWSEGTSTVTGSDNGYNVLVGGTLFDSYADHPRRKIWVGRIKDYSTAAGRYQLLARYYDFYTKQLHLPDFSPATQDEIALEQIKECHALSDIASGDLLSAIHKCSHIWASLPGNNYGQHVQAISDLTDVYIAAGGTIKPPDKEDV